jgi:DNA-binding MarR family transcriptional regulator
MPESAFGLKKPGHSPGFLLWQTMVTWQRLVKKALDDQGISHAQFVILAILLWFEENQIQPNQVFIVNRSRLDKMTVSKSLKSLAQQGLVRRAEHQKDTRAKSVRLTDKGKSLARKLAPLVEKVDGEFFGGVSPGDRKTLVKILGVLVSNIQE